MTYVNQKFLTSEIYKPRPLKIDNEDLIPSDFKFIVVQIDKDALRQALEDGENIQGAHLEERGLYLKIF